MNGMNYVLKRRILICVTGMPGAGKTVIARYIAEGLGAKLYSMGEVVRRIAKEAGIGLDARSMMEFAKDLRKIHGGSVIARLVADELSRDENMLVVIDGVRSLDEIAEFRKYGEVILVGVHASPRQRFIRLKSRKRPDDPKTWEEFTERDMKELELGIGNVIALADIMVVNEDNSLNVISQNALSKVREVLSRIVYVEGRSGGETY